MVCAAACQNDTVPVVTGIGRALWFRIGFYVLYMGCRGFPTFAYPADKAWKRALT